MKYVLLIYENDDERLAHDAERTPHCAAYADAMAKAGVTLTSDRLHPTSMSTTVRVANGKTQVLDGPYAEAKEQLAGFYVIDVPDLDAALAWAARCPSAQHGAVEVRPVWPL
jgi:hypothetical protein